MTQGFIVIVIIGSIIILFLQNVWKESDMYILKAPFPDHWRSILNEKVEFYRNLLPEEKGLFEKKVQLFLGRIRIIGVKTNIDDVDRLLVAASGVIPVYRFPNWRYNNLSEVLLYPGAFTSKFDIKGKDRKMIGMVGTGYMNGKMILSKPSLHQGFKNEDDKKNVGIHEFIHLIDKADGSIDGVPQALLERQYAIPWMAMVKEEIDKILEGKSEIDGYGGTNKAEFFSVASEYFFERPGLLKEKHPELYTLLERIFKHDMTILKHRRRKKQETGRNDPCPCGSGEKFKYCCGSLLKRKKIYS